MSTTPGTNSLRLGIVSDTHGHVAFTQQAVDILREQRVDVVLHCGDIGSTSIIPCFAEWPTHFVFGNVDDYDQDLGLAIQNAGQTCHFQFGELELAGTRIALLHSHDARRFEKVTLSGDYDLVCYGHTHQAEQHFVGRTLVLNPGALYRANPRSCAVVELPTLLVESLVVG